MNNINTISDYFQLLQEKFNLVISAENTLACTAAIALTLIIALIITKIIHNKLKRATIAETIIRKNAFPLLVALGIATSNLINFALNEPHNILLIFSLKLFIAAIVINLIEFLLHYLFAKRHYAVYFTKTIIIMLWIASIVIITDANDGIINLLDSITFHIGKNTQLSIWDILHALVTIILIVVVAMLINRYSERKINRIKQIDTNIRQIMIRISKIVIFILSAMITLPILGIDITALSVFGGALGVGLGFGLQKIASNFLSGFIILLDRSIKVGDRLILDNNSGSVTKITTRYVVLERFDGTEVLIPNETFITNSIQNQSYSSKRLRSEILLTISNKIDINQALELIKQAIQSAPNTISDKAAVMISKLVDNGLEVKGYYWVEQPDFIVEAGNYIYIQIVKLFKENSIATPQTTRRIEVINRA
ncbi:MAG: mechanosensitive ion channel [Burkholderiales bacterium]|jgi:small-conductance mechanosensitive channel|nr:mechanosensitive ion channel [Burkholderiales bacterium]